MRYWWIALLLACGAPGTGPEEVAPDPCSTWNTEGFFKRASADDVAACVKAGHSISARNGDQQSPICMAARYANDPGVIEALVRHGALVDDWCSFSNWVRLGCPNASPLHLAAAFNQNLPVI